MLRNTRKYQNWIWAGVLLAQFLLFYLVSLNSELNQRLENFFEIQKGLHQKIFSFAPFSIGDLFYILLIAFFAFTLWQLRNKKKRSKTIFLLLITANFLHFFYQIFWGILYFQKPIYPLETLRQPTEEQLKSLTLYYLERAKSSREEVQEDEQGVFTITKLNVLQSEILLNQEQNLSGQLQLRTTGINNFKPSLFGKIMNYTGILGYYNPFTSEAQYNAHLPSTNLPFTLAHESAHQLGYAREQEANFIAFLIGKDSKNPELRYSTNYTVLKHLLWSIHEKDPKFVRSVLDGYTIPMQKDYRNEQNFYNNHAGLLSQFFLFTNDLFLKSNRQEGRVTYSYFIQLLNLYHLDKQGK